MGNRLHAGMAHLPALEEEPKKETPEVDFVKWLSLMRADLAQSLNGVLLRGALSRPIPTVDTGTGTARISGSAGRLVGWSVRETTGSAPAVLRLRDSRDTSGPIVATIQLAQGTSQTVSLDSSGVAFVDALSVEVVSGTVEGAIWLGATS